MTETALKSIPGWVLAILILIVLSLTFIGPKGVSLAYKAIADRANWDVLNPFSTEPERKHPFETVLADQNKVKDTLFSVAEIKTVLSTPVCLSEQSLNGKKYYLMKGEISSRPLYFLFGPEQQVMGTVLPTQEPETDVEIAYRTMLAPNNPSTMKLDEEILGQFNSVSGLYANCKSENKRNICDEISFDALDKAIESCGEQ